MRLAFVQKSAFPLMGVMSIAAFVKAGGHKVDLFLVDEEKDIISSLKKYKPDVVAIPCFTGEQDWAVAFCREVKRKTRGVITLLGGPHPTYYPEIVKERGIDVVVRGEAEGGMLDLLNALEKKKSFLRINNIWINKNNRVYKNRLRPLITNLDQLPYPERVIYYKYDFLKKASVKQFLTARGCPYNCTFCSNHLLREMYKGKGCYLRRRSPKNVIEEIRKVKKNYGFKTISFTDDVFATNKTWLKKFLSLYKKEVKTPFMANVTANLIDEPLVKMLKKGGCYGVAMGIETGNEKLRLKVLKKNITNKQILNAGKLIRKYKLELKTYNILCLPGESLENAWETVMINVRVKPQSATASLLQPFPGYQITDYAIKEGYLADNFSLREVGDSIYKRSPIKLPQKREICNLQNFFPLVVQFPQLIPIVKLLIKLPIDPLYDFLGRAFYGFSMSKVHRLTWGDIWRFARHLDPFKV